MPSIQELHDSLKDANVAFLIVSDEETDKVKRTVSKLGWSLPVYLATEGFPPVLRTQGWPTTFVANSKGQVVYHMMGGKDWNTDDARGFLQKIP
jgi:hypothetical protein